MKVVGLDGRTYTWNLRGLQVKLDDPQHRSELHIKARQLLHALFPLQPILEEVRLPGTNNLRADFYIPSWKLMIEVNGEQHYQFSLHHHGSRAGFLSSLKRDSDKARWCDLNDIQLVTLPYNEDIDEWRVRITEG